MKILIVLTSADQIPGTDRKTGTWFEELTAPYYAFRDANAEVTLASVAGGHAPIDPWSLNDDAQTETTKRFSTDPVAQNALANTVKLSDIQAEDYDATFYSGGMGPVFDLSGDPKSVALIEAAFRAHKPLAAVCQWRGRPTVGQNLRRQTAGTRPQRHGIFQQ